LLLAYGIGRLGCHFAGDGDWGIPSDLAQKPSFLPDWLWSSSYAHNVLKTDTPIAGCDSAQWGDYCFQLGQAAYPTPLYEALACGLLFGILWMVRKKVKIPGQIFALYLIFNGLERFFVEKIRVNNKMDILGFHPTQAELISTALFLSGVLLWLWLGRRRS
jgi:prolipoprotein diacylglyceryltransferase